MSTVQLKDISCRILDGIHLNLAEGEAVAILGASGAGKSTLLKVIAGLLPYRGQIWFDGQSVDKLPPYRRSLGYLSQELHLFPHLTVKGNIFLALAFDFAGRDTRQERVREALRLTQASHLAQRTPHSLSGGERQRAALARCLARHPKLLLLDEPFSSLDPAIKMALWQEVGELRQRLGMTMLIVTHDSTEANTLADRTVCLREGHLFTLQNNENS